MELDGHADMNKAIHDAFVNNSKELGDLELDGVVVITRWVTPGRTGEYDGAIGNEFQFKVAASKDVPDHIVLSMMVEAMHSLGPVGALIARRMDKWRSSFGN
jgi:hypothetical protein